ncbi:MAG: TVP38/TMEM64 family protein [Bdellovibrionia bacterium]
MKKKEHSLLRPFVLLAIVAAVLLLCKSLGAGEWITGLRDWIESLGVPGIFAFMAVYILGVVAVLPGTALTLIAATLFGPVLGIVIVSIASTIGACIAFLIARHFAADTVGRWLNKSEKFRRLDRLTATHGDIMVAVTRLVPILPYNLLNYAFGLTHVPFWTYLFWSWVCMLPATAINVLSMDAVATAVSEGRISATAAALLAATVAVFIVLYRFADKKLDEADVTAK